MELTSLQVLSSCTKGRLQLGAEADSSWLVNGISTDSRQVRPGNLYVALRGENFDGHTFVSDACARGCVASIVDEQFARSDAATHSLQSGAAFIIVEDTLVAYQAIAAWHRKRLSELEVVGITGSNGKTTTKDFVAAVLRSRYHVLKTEGNFNNHIGVPHTLMRLNNTHEAAVVEMGINHPGEMLPLTEMAAATSAIITNIGSAHLEFMGSKRTTALEKSILVSSLPANGVSVLPGDDEFHDLMAQRAGGIIVTTGGSTGSCVAERVTQDAEGSEFTVRFADGGREPSRVRFPGKHVVANALFAFAVGRAFNLSSNECSVALSTATLTSGRVELRLVGGVRFLDDSYNANPESVVAALDALKQFPVQDGSRKFAVLGAMGELGEAAEAGYRTVGAAAGLAAIDGIITVGPEARRIDEPARQAGAKHVLNLPTTATAAEYLAEFAQPGDAVLVKGSRSARMEKVIEHFASLAQLNAQTLTQ